MLNVYLPIEARSVWRLHPTSSLSLTMLFSLWQLVSHYHYIIEYRNRETFFAKISLTFKELEMAGDAQQWTIRQINSKYIYHYIVFQ